MPGFQDIADRARAPTAAAYQSHTNQLLRRSLAGEEESAAIIRAVTGLGRSLGMITTAEGVETTDQLELLRKEGCMEVQGFLFSVPVPSEEISRLLERVNKSLKAA